MGANTGALGAHSLRTVVVDDESLARRGLKLRLQALDGVEVVAECRNGREALDAVGEQAPDLLFLDIQMPGMDGLDVVRELQSDDMPLIVFVTAYDQYAVQAFDLHAVDYVLKPVEEDRLADAVDRARTLLADRDASRDKARLLGLVQTMTGRSEDDIAALMDAPETGATSGRRYPEKLTIRDGATTTLVPMDTIDWVDAAGDYMCVHASGETHVMRITMKALEAQLDPERFTRVHRSTIVNAARVSKVCSHMNGEYFLTLDCGARLKMSRTYRDRIEAILGG
jgi:two-component system LytT family response regulator